MSESVVRAGPPHVSDAEVTWSGTLHHGSDEPAGVTWRSTTGTPPPDGAVRPFLLAFLPVAMWLGDPLVVEGELGRGEVDALMEWQEAMASTNPGTLRPVPIRAEGMQGEPETEPTSAGRRGAVTAFSGGVDSCFTAVRHRPGGADRPEAGCHRRTTVRAGLMVAGFDIGIDDLDTFDRAFARSARMLAGLDIEALQVRTDVRSLERRFPLDWETATHGIWLAAALATIEHRYERTIIPSTFTYAHPHAPWASTPATDPLLGSATTPLWHDGAAHDKLAKVGHLVDHPAVVADLRVCWRGEHLDRNCGHCFKCLATQACFWVHGVERPGAFDDPATPEELAALPIARPYQRDVVQSIHDGALAADRPDLTIPLAAALEAAP